MKHFHVQICDPPGLKLIPEGRGCGWLAAVPPVTWLSWPGRETESRARVEKTGLLFRSNHTAVARLCGTTEFCKIRNENQPMSQCRWKVGWEPGLEWGAGNGKCCVMSCLAIVSQTLRKGVYGFCTGQGTVWQLLLGLEVPPRSLKLKQISLFVSLPFSRPCL